MSALTWVLTFGVAIGIFSVLSRAILAFFAVVIDFVLPPILTDVIGVFSVYLPFNPASFLTTLLYVATSITTFLIALKVYDILHSVLTGAKA